MRLGELQASFPRASLTSSQQCASRQRQRLAVEPSQPTYRVRPLAFTFLEPTANALNPNSSAALSASAVPTSSTLPTGNRDTVDNGLSTGAIAGIVVGIVSLFAIYGLYLLVRRRQKRQQQYNSRQQDMVGMQRMPDSSATLEKVTVASGNAANPYAPKISSRMAPDSKQKGRAV